MEYQRNFLRVETVYLPKFNISRDLITTFLSGSPDRNIFTRLVSNIGVAFIQSVTDREEKIYHINQCAKYKIGGNFGFLGLSDFAHVKIYLNVDPPE